MAKRESVYVIKRTPTPGTDHDADRAHEEINLPNPNRYVPEVTLELRAHFPPHTSKADVLNAYAEAVHEFEEEMMAALNALQNQREEINRRRQQNL